MAPSDRGPATVCLPELRRGGVAAFVGTLFARSAPMFPLQRPPLRSDTDAGSPAIAHAQAMAQLAYYRCLERQGHLVILETAEALDRHWAQAEAQILRPLAAPVACILMVEGGDAITSPAELDVWHRQGVRAAGIAHTLPNAYATGNTGDGPLTAAGRDLLAGMADLGLALDLSHLCDRSFADAIDAFDGLVFASHSNCRALAAGPRQLGNDQLKLLAQRDAVVGMVVHNGMLKTGWTAGKNPRSEVGLVTLVQHIDHLCQLTGSARHAAIGSDLDGGYGTERCPHDLDSIADLPSLGGLLAARGYAPADVAAILHGNWRRFWRGVLAGKAAPTSQARGA